MRVFEFIHKEKVMQLNPQVPKADVVRLKQIATHEHYAVSDVCRAAIRSFLYEYKEVERRGKYLSPKWLSYRPENVEKMTRIKVLLHRTEIAELMRITSVEGKRLGMKLSAPAIIRAVFRAFLIVQKEADEAGRSVEAIEGAEMFPPNSTEGSRLTA